MSVDVFIQAFDNGDPQPMKTKDIMACFDGVVTGRGDGYIDVSFGPQNSSSIYFAVDEETDTGVVINRPCGDRELARRLYRIMQLGNCVLYIPGEAGVIVLRESSAAQMPEDMRVELGEARIAPDEETFICLYHNE